MTPEESASLKAYRNKLSKLMHLADVMNIDVYELLRKFRQSKKNDHTQEARPYTQDTNGAVH
jgi:hypothetical protein